MSLKEKQIEDVFEIFYEQLVEKDLVFVARQHTLENKLRIDLLFKDRKGKNLVLELKKDAITREDVGQILQYAGLIKNSRVILAAPIISSSIKTAFDHYGIEYIEFEIKEIEKLYSKISNKSKTETAILAKKIVLPQNIVKEPLAMKTKKDGNVAFKVTYTDSNWSGVCSRNVADYNFKHRTWCGIQSEYTDNCQSKTYSNPKKLNSNFFPCHDCVALKELMFYPGHFHGEKHNNEPKRCLNAKVGKIAVFTSREPGESENERFIFAVGQMDYFEKCPDERGNYELFHCNKETALIFDKTNYPKFWNYYKNPNTPDAIAWKTGLIRYLDDSVIRNILNDVIKKKNYSDEQKMKAKNLLTNL